MTKPLARLARPLAWTILPALIATLAFYSLVAPTMADAAGTVSTSVSVGCKSAAGVKTLTVKATAKSTGTRFITNVTVDVGNPVVLTGTTGAINTQSAPQVTAAGILAPGSYPILITISTNEGPATKTGNATITANGCSVKVG